MALCACTNCGNKVSSAGLNCPKCGYPVAKTLEEIERAEKTRQLREQQLANIEAGINYYQHEIQVALKAYEEVSLLSKYSSAISNWKEHLERKEGKYSAAENVLEMIQKEFPVEYIKIKEDTDAEFSSKNSFSQDDKKGENIACPECRAKYSANLLECPSCGWTANRKLVEELRVVEKKRIQTLLTRLSHMLSDKCEPYSLYAYGRPASTGYKYLLEKLDSKREELSRKLTLMKSFVDEVKHSPSVDMLSYVGKRYYSNDITLHITFNPCGYAYLNSGHDYDVIEELYAKKHHVYPRSSGWGENYECWYEFSFSYQEAIKLIDDLSKSGFSMKKTEEMELTYLSGFEISKLYNGWKTLIGYTRDATNVVMPNSVQKMSSGVFTCRKNLNRIVLSNALREIPEHAFAGCVDLREVIIFPSVYRIEYSAFYGCKNLKFIIVADEGKSNIEGERFAKVNGIPYERLTPEEFARR